jgi:hypothetical protein
MDGWLFPPNPCMKLLGSELIKFAAQARQP